jgi:hypothetical protein
MVLVLEKISRPWTVCALLVAGLSGKVAGGMIPEDIDSSIGLVICILLGTITTGVFFEELKEKYFLDYEKKRDSVLLALLFVGIFSMILLSLCIKEIIVLQIPETDIILKYLTMFLVGSLLFMSVIFVQGQSYVNYRKSHEKIGELCRKIVKFRNSQYDFGDEEIGDEIKDLLDVMMILKQNISKNIKNENEENRSSLRRFELNVICLENVFKSYYNFFHFCEISRVFSPKNYPLFLNVSRPPNITLSKALEIASKSVTDFKDLLGKSKVEAFLVKPLYVLIPGCKNYDELYMWRHQEHKLSIGAHNDNVLLRFLQATSMKRCDLPIITFDLYGEPPSFFNSREEFISDLKASAKKEKKLFPCLFSEDCLSKDTCRAGIETLKEVARRRSDLELRCEKIDDEVHLRDFLSECYEFYTYLSGQDLQNDKEKYGWCLDV